MVEPPTGAAAASAALDGGRQRRLRSAGWPRAASICMLDQFAVAGAIGERIALYRREREGARHASIRCRWRWRARSTSRSDAADRQAALARLAAHNAAHARRVARARRQGRLARPRLCGHARRDRAQRAVRHAGRDRARLEALREAGVEYVLLNDPRRRGATAALRPRGHAGVCVTGRGVICFFTSVERDTACRTDRLRWGEGVKTVALAIVGTIMIFALGVSDARTQRAYRDGISGGGYCPTGTCSKGGGPRANDLKNCKKENCRR